MLDILLLGKKKLSKIKKNERFQIHCVDEFPHIEDLEEYIAKNVFDIIIVDVHHPTRPRTLRKFGHKGLIVGFSDNSANKQILRNTLLRGFNMYFSFEELQNQLMYIVEAFSNIPKFEIDYSEKEFDMEIYDHIIKHAGNFIYEQFAQTFFETHEQAHWAFVSQDMVVVEHSNREDAPEVNDLSNLMMKNEQYIFLFSRKQTVPQLTE